MKGKTTDILLDLSVNIHAVKREPTKDTPIYPNHIVIKGFKYSLVAELEVTQCTVHPWNQYFTGIKSFVVYDPDGFIVNDYHSDLLQEWIVTNFFYKNIDSFKHQSYLSYEDWKVNSPLIELEYLTAEQI